MLHGKPIITCKHVAATLYGTGARLDEKPELLFLLRGVDHREMVSEESAKAVVAKAPAKKGRTLDADKLVEVFGIDITGGKSIPAARSSARVKPKRKNKSAIKDRF